jgi:hypothetical protein
VTRTGRRIVVQAEGMQYPWSVQVAGGPSSPASSGASRLEIEL